MTQAAEPQSAPPQYSPDGQWWWTGIEWVPVPPQATAPVAAPATTVVPAGYGAPGYAGFAATGTRTSGLAIAALVLGILWIVGLGSLLALIFGLLALNQINKSGGSITGRGLAIAGVVLGGLGLLLATFAAIGTYSTANQDQNALAHEARMKADLRTAAALEETYYTEHQTYTGSTGDLGTSGIAMPVDEDLQILDATDTGYCLSATHPGVTTWYYNSDQVGITTVPCA